MMNSDVQQELLEMGFKGLLLHKLLNIIVDGDSLQDFYNFILLKGEGMSKVMLVHNYSEHIDNKRTYASYQEFVDDYDKAVTKQEKLSTIEKLILGKVSSEKLNKVVMVFEIHRERDFKKLFQKMERYRKEYNIFEIITLLEAMTTQ